MFKKHSGVVTECTETHHLLPAGTKNLDRDNRRTALWHRGWDVSSGDSDLSLNCSSKSAEEFEPGPSRASWVSYPWSCTIAGNLTSASVPSTYQECSLLHPAPQSSHHWLSVACGGGLQQRLSPEAWRALRDRAQLWVCTWRALKKGKHWFCCRRLNQYFCNGLLQQMGLALGSRLSLAKHSIQHACAAFRLQPS